MLIFLYGADSYRRIQKLSEIVEAFRKKQSNLSHERFDLSDEEEFFKFQSFAGNRSIFDPVRLAVLDGFDPSPFKKKGEGLIASNLKELKAILKTHFEAKDLVIVINSDKKPAATFNAFLKPPTQIQEFPVLTDAETASFIKKTAKALGFTIDTQTTYALIQTFGGNSWGIATELEKMTLADGQAKQALSIHKPADNFFPLVNTLKYSRSLRDRLVALEVILSDRKDEPAKVFNMLVYRLRSQEEADVLADYDVAVKSGKLEYEEVLLDYALS